MELSLIQKICVWALPLIFAITLHEVAHGWIASFFGDQTARLQGRLSLNPIRHIDPIGTIVLPLLMLLFSNFIFGWAKPVPVDSRNMRHPRRDMIFVSAAGPLSNVVMALAWAGIAKLGYLLMPHYAWFGVPMAYMGEAGIMINIVLAVLNLIPIPPLDGGQIVLNLLPKKIAFYYARLMPYGFLILIILLMTGILSHVMTPIIGMTIKTISTLFGL